MNNKFASAIDVDHESQVIIINTHENEEEDEQYYPVLGKSQDLIKTDND